MNRLPLNWTTSNEPRFGHIAVVCIFFFLFTRISRRRSSRGMDPRKLGRGRGGIDRNQEAEDSNRDIRP